MRRARRSRTAAKLDPVSEPVHPFAWFSAEALDILPMFADTLLLAQARWRSSR